MMTRIKDYYHQKVSVRLASQVTERLNTQDLTELENFKKTLKCFDLIMMINPATLKQNFDAFQLKKMQNTAVKHFIENLFYLNL